MDINNEKNKKILDELNQLELEVQLANEKKNMMNNGGSANLKKSNHELIQSAATPLKSDFQLFSGIVLLLIGLLMLFQHVRVGTGALAFLGLGSGGFGFVLLPLLVGIGWIFYNPKNKIAWFVTAFALVLIFFSILSSLIMYFPTMSLMSTLIMLLPLSFGVVMILKGLGGPKAIAQNFNKITDNGDSK